MAHVCELEDSIGFLSHAAYARRNVRTTARRHVRRNGLAEPLGVINEARRGLDEARQARRGEA
eukprot:scaffold30424_cov42-Phaeocystis_antarctica.AAC.1